MLRHGKGLAAIVGGLAVLVGFQGLAQAQVVIRTATLAPSNSKWAEELRKGAAEVAAKTGGKVRIKYYFDGSQGDEGQAVTKMDLGQLDSVAVTTVGLAAKLRAFRLFDLPGVIKTDGQLSSARYLWAWYQKRMMKKGYQLGPMGKVGPTMLFSTFKISAPGDFGKCKMWIWPGHLIAGNYTSNLGVTKQVRVGVPDVLRKLRSGDITCMLAPPYALLVLQWHTKVRHVIDYVHYQQIGSTFTKVKVLSKINPAHLNMMRQVQSKYSAKLWNAISTLNRDAMNTIARRVRKHKPDAAMKAHFKTAAKASNDKYKRHVGSKRQAALYRIVGHKW